MSALSFGIEIEAVVGPWTIRPEWNTQPANYYETFALALQYRGLIALADSLTTARQSQHAEYYNKWFITGDGSLWLV
jgi:hypothetical protein